MLTMNAAPNISNQVKKSPKGNLRGNAQGKVAAQAVMVRDKGTGIGTTCKQKVHSWGKAVQVISIWPAVKMMSQSVTGFSSFT